ncbi:MULTISPECIES: aldehyde dehydrogenase family protein [Helcobacillus]|uniref:Phenylacetaldehyde dehydrogenase n=1 Tax=Helcobacillus massiliensis TaxID=521392 RepID=A0A839QV91_9MICO|nr:MULTISPECIES: aldehyde dehydrogenase family protein [Helcobacillus]MBB3023645.1 phenylacetaldehyde dehydrogenase [Helcobacillus massiliensis]MCG7427828.1 aldehyde dehydrogenase family protein [Helcobacillus sp. ACRRO]MDK7741622.1 aldehyde dehydrogenase family protein [Helcobacillus massiliensis]WOO92666.1 aldehyde dehydrogenase family protein [Helcobacillus massiliensis]
METFESLLAAVAADSGREVLNPATGELIGHVAQHTEKDLDAAVEKAAAAQKEWAKKSDEERVAALMKAADEVEQNAGALAEIICREQGKPLSGPGANFEAGAVVGWMRATCATELKPEEIDLGDGKKATVHHRPVGVVGGVNPWNWPAMIATWQFAPALRMGNSIVMKPASDTPLSVLATAYLVNKHLPEGLLTVLTGPGSLGGAISAHPGFAKITFTGSTETGKKIAEAASQNLARLTLELGGNDAGIVLPDVDGKEIAEGLFWGAFINTGQTCACLKRLYVHEDVYDDVVGALVEVAKQMPMGDGMDEKNVLGPLTNESQQKIVADLVNDAKNRGGNVLFEGEVAGGDKGFFHPLTLIDSLPADARLITEEQFGPALPIIKYSDVDDAIEQANSVEVGLGASVWSKDPAKAAEVAARIEAGTVWINSHGTINPMAPFGGIKQSGYGVEFGVEGLKAFTVPQVIHS